MGVARGVTWGALKKYRKKRCMTAINSEWQQVCEQAKIADMTISRYVIERLIQTLDISGASVKTDNFPVSLQWQMTREVKLMFTTIRQQFNDPEWQQYYADLEEIITRDFEKERLLNNS